MQHQFDIIVLTHESFQPPIEDSALGWFFAENFSEVIPKLDAEWTICIQPQIQITSEFLNAAADLCLEFPFADAFAPRILFQGNCISSGFLLERKRGLIKEFKKNPANEFRKIASLPAECGIYSTRLLQALGDFDDEFKTDLKFFDLGLRALHLGANLFATPQLQIAIVEKRKNSIDNKELARIYFKDLSLGHFLHFTLHHPLTFFAIFKNRKELEEKSLEVTEISKLTEETLKELRV